MYDVHMRKIGHNTVVLCVGERHGRKPEMYARLMPHWTGGAKITMSMYSGSSQTYHLWHPQTVNHRILALCLFLALASTSTEDLGTRKCRGGGGGGVLDGD